jgi:hypothetical protein
MLAPSWSPIITITTLPLSLQSPSVVYNSSVQKSHEWFRDRQSEESAQLETAKGELIAAAHCEICDIGIGPDHLEQELFVYPEHGERDVLCIIQGREHLLTKEDIRAMGGYWFYCCGGCARSRKRQLPESYCIYSYQHWTTNLLIQQEGEPLRALTDADFQAIWLAKDAYRSMKINLFLLLQLVPHLVALGVSLRAYFALLSPNGPEPVTPAQALFVLPASRSGFVMRTPTPMLAS